MKRLTKDERTGATAIALVALIICGGSFLWNRRERGTPESEEIVRSIILASDSLDRENEPSMGNDGDSSEFKEKRRKNERDTTSNGEEKRKRRKKKTTEKKKNNATPSRDFLSDPI